MDLKKIKVTPNTRKFPLDVGARAINPGQMILLYAACDTLTESKKINEKWKLYFRIRWETGIRPSEGLNLTASDIQNDHIIVYRLKKKEHRPDFVHIQPSLSLAIQDYILKYKIKKRLFPHTIQGATFIFNKIKQKIGLPWYITLHSFRHGFAMNYLGQLPSQTHPVIALTQLQRLLGHKSLTHVINYIRADKSETDKVIDQMKF